MPRYTTVWMDYLRKKNVFFGCQGRVGPFFGCSSTVMDPPRHFCLFLWLGDG